jgi:hypothetical protein
MVHQVVDLGGMKIGATGLAASHDVIAGFVSAQASGARVGVVGVDAVSNTGSQPWEIFWILSCEVSVRFLHER